MTLNFLPVYPFDSSFFSDSRKNFTPDKGINVVRHYQRIGCPGCPTCPRCPIVLSGTTRATETRTAPEIGGVSLQLVYQVRFDVDVYGSVPGECPTPLFVSAEAADQVGILHLIVKVPNESPSR